MKGDEGIQMREEGPDGVLLLARRWQHERRFEKVVRRDVEQSVVASALGCDHLNSLVPSVRLVIRHEEIGVCTVEAEAYVQRRYAALIIVLQPFYGTPGTAIRSALVVGELSFV